MPDTVIEKQDMLSFCLRQNKNVGGHLKCDVLDNQVLQQHQSKLITIMTTLLEKSDRASRYLLRCMMKSFIQDDDCPGELERYDPETRQGKLFCSGTNSSFQIQRFSIVLAFNEPYEHVYDTVHFEWRVPINAKQLDLEVLPEIQGYKMVSKFTVQLPMRLSGSFSFVWEYQRCGRIVSFVYRANLGTDKLDLSAAVYKNPVDWDNMSDQELTEFEQVIKEEAEYESQEAAENESWYPPDSLPSRFGIIDEDDSGICSRRG